MITMEWLVVVGLVALVLFVAFGVIDFLTEPEPSRVEQPVKAHTPLPPVRRPNAVTWARADQAPPAPVRHRRPGSDR